MQTRVVRTLIFCINLPTHEALRWAWKRHERTLSFDIYHLTLHISIFFVCIFVCLSLRIAHFIFLFLHLVFLLPNDLLPSMSIRCSQSYWKSAFFHLLLCFRLTVTSFCIREKVESRRTPWMRCGWLWMSVDLVMIVEWHMEQNPTHPRQSAA